MARWCVLAGGPNTLDMAGFDAYVGVDSGCLYLLEKDMGLDLAVGDFDSVSDLEKDTIVQKARRLVSAPAEKDDTDLELALKLIFEEDPQAKVTVFGALGGRLDHSLSNIFLPSYPDLASFMRQLILVDEQNYVAYYPPGRNLILPQETYPYVAFLLEGEGQLVIEGAKYDLGPGNYFKRKIYSSNEFLDGPIQVTVPDGYLVVIYSKD